MDTLKILMFLTLGVILSAEGRPQNVQQPGQVVSYPFYGGAKGQLLQISRDQSGNIISQIIIPENQNAIQNNDNRLPFIPDDLRRDQQFSANLYNIQSSAQRLVELQQKTAKLGQLKSGDQTVYANNLAVLGESATNLAKLSGQGSYDLSALFGVRKEMRRSELVDKSNKKKGEIRQEELQEQNDFQDQQDVQGQQDVTQAQFEDEEDVGEEQGGNESDQQQTMSDDDTVQVNTPDSASVAEAKPIGVAIAGEGGVASSKPVATAVVGPGGLAIARPVATAIAGVDPKNVNLAGIKNPISVVQRRAEQTVAYQPIMQFYNPAPQYYPYIAI